LKDGDYTVVAIDQTRKAVRTYLTHGWFQEGERPTLPVSGAWNSVKLLGALTDQGETTFFECESNFTSEVTIHLLQALQQEFGEKIAVVLDNASYFTANAVKDFAEETSIELIYLPRGSPKLNPVEECWRQFKQFLGNRSFEDVPQLRKAIPVALDAINRPNLHNYLCL
jgi:transposase